MLHNRGSLSADSSAFVENVGRIGGALWLDRGVDTLSNVLFRANQATFNTGLHNQKGDVYVANARFLNNVGRGTAAVWADEGKTILTNAVFSGNIGTAEDLGSLISSFDGELFLHNSTISGNSVQVLMRIIGGNNSISSSVIWGNQGRSFTDPRGGTIVVSNSDVQGGFSELIVDGGGDYDEPTPIDLLGAVRVYEPGSGKAAIVDMGAHDLSVFDMMGRLVDSAASVGVSSAAILDIDVANFPAGTYLIRITGKDWATSRIVTVVR